ncbi:MAG: efflux RND transporter periplasmic adaptor subunit [Thalassobaculum sp.]|uniref:efflux RND transporter periplasmic adaptor subunit n=1 Tax=Thalassobaculum sp. TaxID=2022740 RepID=UPI0032EEE9DB
MLSRRIVHACALAGLLASGHALAQSAGSGPAVPLPAVTYVVAAEKDVTPQASFVGRMEAVQRVGLRARIDGFLEQQPIADGARVGRGDLIYVIEQAPFAARVQEAEANLEAAKAQLENARVQFERADQLAKRGNISQATVDERRADFLVAKASVAQAEAALQSALITFSYTEIRSPIDGQIGRSSVKVGNLVSPDSGVLATIVRNDPIHVVFGISEKMLLQFRRDTGAGKADSGDALGLLRLRLRLADETTYEHPGTLDFADVQVNASTDTVALRGTFPNPDDLLIDGQYVVVVVQSKQPVSALVVPRAAVGVDQRGSFVLLVGEGDTVEQRVIALGDQFGSDVTVKAGLKPGDRVIVNGMLKVRPGMRVTASAAEPKA